jgi:plastocyanin
MLAVMTPSRCFALGAGLLGCLLAMSEAPAAQVGAAVRGRVTIAIPVATRRPANTYSRSAQRTALAPASELRNVIVYLKEAPTGSVAPTRAEIRQVNETFVPRAIAVTVGSEVSFPNGDPFFHNVFSLSRTRTFDLGRYPSGQTRTVRFDRAGLVKVFCQIHSHMSASVMIFDHPWFAVPDEHGAFNLSNVPPGARRLAAWHERFGETTISVRLEAGRPATVDFVLPVPRP